jgi:hypothetical protein
MASTNKEEFQDRVGVSRRSGFALVYTAFLDDERVGKNAKLAMMALASYANAERECYPSIKALCKRASLSDKSLMAGINELIELGYLEKQVNYSIEKGKPAKQTGEHRSNSYVIIDFPKNVVTTPTLRRNDSDVDVVTTTTEQHHTNNTNEHHNDSGDGNDGKEEDYVDFFRTTFNSELDLSAKEQLNRSTAVANGLTSLYQLLREDERIRDIAKWAAADARQHARTTPSRYIGYRLHNPQELLSAYREAQQHREIKPKTPVHFREISKVLGKHPADFDEAEEALYQRLEGSHVELDGMSLRDYILAELEKERKSA